MTALSGPYAIASAPMGVGTSDFIGWYNEQGGLKGIPVEVILVDHAGEIPKTLDAYARFLAMNPRPPILSVGCSGPAEALHDRFVEDGVINITGALSNKTLYPPGNTFTHFMSDPDRVGAVMDWLVDVWSPKTKLPVKWAFICWDNPMGRSPMSQENLDYAAKRGIQVVANEVFPWTASDVSTQVLKAKEAGANFVWCTGNAAVVARSAAALGLLTNDIWDITPGKIRIGSTAANSEGLIRIGGEFVEGEVTFEAVACWNETDVPFIKLMHELAEKNNRQPEEEGLYYVGAAAGAALTMYVTEQAINEVGWDKLNSTAIRKQVLKLRNAGPKGWSPMGAAYYAYTEDKLSPRWGKIYVINEGKVMPISDLRLAPDLKPYDWKGTKQ
jgi:ABC-type branched-subunit amino acid transport system substrate-binding protein